MKVLLFKFTYITNLPLLYALIFSYIATIFIKKKKSEIENMRLKEENVKAQLASLKEQISPHFFFNTLSTLSSVIRTQKKELSLEFIDELSRVYHYILECNEKNTIHLKKEIKFIESYFYLLQKRFGERIQLVIDLENNIPTVEIPPLSLQVCIENAVIHNQSTTDKPLEIRITIDNEYIVIKNLISKIQGSENFGTGLFNLSERFKLIMNKDVIILQEDGNFIVKLPIKYENHNN
ncbi:histidine kinase [bacterium]|nr:histidine kinase [bacterium]